MKRASRRRRCVAGSKLWFPVFGTFPRIEMDPGDGLQKFDVWGREAGEGRRTGVGTCGVPTFQAVDHWRQGLATSADKCFRVVELWGSIPFIPVGSGVWGLVGCDPEANLAAREHASRYRNRPPVGLGCRISSTHPAAGDRRLQRMLAGEGAWSSGGLKAVRSWLTRNGACKQYTTSRRVRHRRPGGTGKEGWLGLGGWDKYIGMGDVGRSKGNPHAGRADCICT